MNILVLNCGSSSVKFQVLETDTERIETDTDRCLARGQIERVGSYALSTFQAGDRSPVKETGAIRDHRAAIDRILRWVVSPDAGIDSIRSVGDIHAVGHRVVHGGERFQASVKITEDVLRGIEDCIDLAPLHNPANLKGIRAARDLLGDGVPAVAVFDTAFHSTMPESSYLYAIPYSLYRRYKIRRYGFHGTSHRYVAYRWRRLKDLPPEQATLITLHLGNGCSACAIKAGESFNTSMGFTPLEGLVMGTRSGDLDASIVDYLGEKEGLSVHEVMTLLNKQSGLLGLSGLTGDMRDLLEEEAEKDDRRARLAVDIFCRRVAQYIGAYLADLGGARAVIFTGGIGENSAEVRQRSCRGLEALGILLDPDRNAALPRGAAGIVSREDSPVEVWVIPTNEELVIARDTFRVVTDAPRRW